MTTTTLSLRAPARVRAAQPVARAQSVAPPAPSPASEPALAQAPRNGTAPSTRTTRAARMQQLAAAYVSKRVTHIALDHRALADNIALVKSKIGGASMCAVVKANAYGHGAVEVARVALANGADRLAVATVAEGVELRGAGIDAPILVLGFTSPDEARDVVAFELAATVCSVEAGAALAKAAEQQGVKAKVHVKVNVGMNRLGVAPSEAVALVEQLAKNKALDVEGIFTHFPNADSDLAQTRAQLASFVEVVDALEAKGLRPRIAHAANSDAALTLPEAHLDMVRAGTALYGLMPGTKPILTWQTQIAHVNTLKDGEGVSYGHTWRAQGERKVAVIPVGWADGFAAGAEGWREVLVNGKRAPVVGAIAMDQAMIDVTDVGPLKPGAPVVLLGAQGAERITAEDASKWLGGVHPVVVTGNIRQRSPSSSFDASWSLRRADAPAFTITRD